ncbi:MAG: hypothetical protein RJA81_1395 [Planctomycetota bacterium]|jgi:hypothetical protein
MIISFLNPNQIMLNGQLSGAYMLIKGAKSSTDQYPGITKGNQQTDK